MDVAVYGGRFNDACVDVSNVLLSLFSSDHPFSIASVVLNPTLAAILPNTPRSLLYDTEEDFS